MKKILLYSAMLAMVIAAAVMATSCQKEKEKEETMKSSVSHFNPENLQIEDMNAYLEGFKEKMQSAAAKGSSETMDIEEAAWHLSSMANHDFAHINALHDTLRFDTLYLHINVNNGRVDMEDLNNTFDEMSRAITNYKKNLNCENPNFWFIGTRISENGLVTVTLTTMFVTNSKYWGDHYWYFLNSSSANSFCSNYLNPVVNYYPETNSITTLEYMLNLMMITPCPADAYLTNECEHDYTFQNHTDPYGSPFYGDSRLFARIGNYDNPIVYIDMCYAFDSYAGFINDHINPNRAATELSIDFEETIIPGNGNIKDICVGNHIMTVHYGRINYVNPNPGGGDL